MAKPSEFNTQIIIDTDELKITCEPGTTQRAVVSFTGLGHVLGGIQKEEFGRSLYDSKSINSIYYVIDKTRSWYNVTCQTIKKLLSTHLLGYREVITLGNSMGGFGSVFFASSLPACCRAIAFSPQFSLLTSHLKNEESRWKEYRDAIHSIELYSALDQPSDQIEYFIFFGSDDPLDMMHARALKSVSPKQMSILMINDCGHNVASILRSRGCLVNLLNALVNERNYRTPEICQILETFGVHYTLL